MHKLLIKDFSLQVHTEFERPLPENQVDLAATAENLVTAFPYVLRTEDILISSEKPPYGYRLLCKLFNGSADLTFANKNVLANFRDGHTKEALAVVTKSVESIYKIVSGRPIQFNQLTFNCNCQFELPEQYKEHMLQYADVERGYLSGGKIVQAEGRLFKGGIRFSTEKSFGFDNSILVNAQFLTQEDLTADVMDQMAKRFSEIASNEGFEFSFPQ